ncbi:MAG: anthranilate phosphoribosyltransferase [Ignavibacteria bacterium]|jgi:anthranilate phosphoribosyltransferase
MIKETIEKLIGKNNLSLDESYSLMIKIMNGEANNSQIASILTALKSKGEVKEEMAGFVKAMREKSIKINAENPKTIDVCGTGGDCSGTFNISTAAAVVIAGAGIPVAKHGNKSMSSKSGSADVLAELGININLSPEKTEEALNKVGISFLFAQLYHPAMKNVAPVRKELGIGTVFNFLGPLTNPAGTKRQVVGVLNNKVSKLMAESIQYLDMEKVCFVCTEDKYDEITLTGDTNVIEYTSGGYFTYSVNNDSFDYPSAKIEELLGDTSKVNAEIINNILSSKENNTAVNVVCANAAMGLYSAGYSGNLNDCKSAAEESIFSGKALSVLNELREFGEQNK